LTGFTSAAAPTASFDDPGGSGQNLGMVSYNGAGVTGTTIPINPSRPNESIVVVVYAGHIGSLVHNLSLTPHSSRGLSFQTIGVSSSGSNDGNAYTIAAYSASTASTGSGSDTIQVSFSGTVNMYQVGVWGFVNSDGATPTIAGGVSSLLTSNQTSYSLTSNARPSTQWAQDVFIGPFGANQANTGTVNGYTRQLGGSAGTANGFLSNKLQGGTQTVTIPTCACDSAAFTHKAGFVCFQFNPITVSSTITDSGGVTFGNLTPTSVTATGTDATGGLQPYTYQWTQNGAPVGGNSLTLNATGLTPGQTYSFALTITDQVGQSVTLTASIQTPTLLVSGVASASNVTSTSATLTVTPATGGRTPYTYQWQQDGANVGAATATTFNATGLTPGTTHTFNCIATDALGQTAGSNVVSVTTTAPLFSGTASASNITATSATLTVTAPTGGVAPFTYQWKQNGTYSGHRQ